MNNLLNQKAEMLISLYEQGFSQQAIINQMFGNLGQVQQGLKQLNNMANGKNINEFYLQILKQNGLTEKNLQGIRKILGV